MIVAPKSKIITKFKIAAQVAMLAKIQNGHLTTITR